MTKNIHSQGFLIIETMIAIVIFSLVGLSLFSSIGMLQIRSQKSKYDSEASLLIQEGTEVAHNAILGDWAEYSDGVYFPVYDNDEEDWILLPGEEYELQTRFTRYVKLISVCRNVTDGVRDENYENSGVCTGKIDENSRVIETTVIWDESGTEKTIVARLLNYRVPEN